MFDNREEETKREKDHERKAKYALLTAAVKRRDQASPSHPRLKLKTPSQTLLPMQPVRTLDKTMPEPAAPHKNIPKLWSVGTLRGGLSPGMP